VLTRPGVKTKVVTALVLTLVFSSGVLLGVAADRAAVGSPSSAVAAPVTSQAAADAPAQGDGERPRRPPVWEQMHPTAAQTVVIDSIMGVHRERMNKLHAEFRVARDVYETNYDALIRETREAIAAVFPPGEAEKYRRLLEESDRRRAAEEADQDDRP
jgi:hypothetical protein